MAWKGKGGLGGNKVGQVEGALAGEAGGCGRN